ncbi:uncharacterized protein STEHIDRAFT_122159 [Stereum hirsutum FP-91666 SS1]|uniref:uncharacterized protein n=1 Tax=Stereum hirsutum (strain FP-91666) TaxID=721885 RepID=UPI0004449458|nr:uncharacterized protein STEHIDRAFT_122159 [Stereum hirsutum FP-91666 SS1]EIM86209.1 hypothetical protein STEHIDRAFT_122159 [Stereum hirsutum FP-91666 SS1]
MRTSTETERVFRFSSIQFTESNPDEIGATEAKWDFSQIGIIEFVVWRGTNTRRKLQEFSSSRTLHVSPVPEGSKKAGWHRVALGEEVKIERRRPCVPKLLDPKDKPYAVIRIRYRPAPLLRANGILPTISSSEAVTTTRTKRVRTGDEPDATSSRKRRKPLVSEEIECHQIKAEVDAASVQVENHGSYTDHEDKGHSEEIQTLQNRLRFLKEKTEVKKGKPRVK